MVDLEKNKKGENALYLEETINKGEEDMNGFTVWFTGLPSSGKSTLARMLENVLKERGFHVEVLDGDEVRLRLSKGLGFSKEDRDENIRRIAYVAKVVTRCGAVAITCAISPYREIRNRKICRGICKMRFRGVYKKGCKRAV